MVVNRASINEEISCVREQDDEKLYTAYRSQMLGYVIISSGSIRDYRNNRSCIPFSWHRSPWSNAGRILALPIRAKVVLNYFSSTEKSGFRAKPDDEYSTLAEKFIFLSSEEYGAYSDFQSEILI